MSTNHPGKRNTIKGCYCSENMRVERCDYCQASWEISRVLDATVPEIKLEDGTLDQEIDEIYDHYRIAPEARLHIMLDLEDKEFKKWENSSQES